MPKANNWNIFTKEKINKSISIRKFPLQTKRISMYKRKKEKKERKWMKMMQWIRISKTEDHQASGRQCNFLKILEKYFFCQVNAMSYFFKVTEIEIIFIWII